MSRELPAGYVPVDDAPLLRDTDQVVKPEAFKDGATVDFSELLSVPKGDKLFKLYLFRHRKHPAVRFGLWATGQLERLMRDVRPGQSVYLRYDGTKPNPNVTGGIIHQWFLARPGIPATVDPTDPEAGAVPVLD